MSLLELSLVLIITTISFFAMNILKKTHDTANLVGLLAEVQYLRKNIDKFYEHYNSYPGDYANASTIWGDKCNFRGTANFNCNGDGDGEITDRTEGFVAWQHLFNAKLYNFEPENLEESYKAKPSVNVARSKILDAGFQIMSDSLLNNSRIYFKGRDNNFIRLAKEKASGNLMQPALSPIDAHYIDYKIDDGFPDKGRVFADKMQSGEILCSKKNNADDFMYMLNIGELSCYMQFSLRI